MPEQMFNGSVITGEMVAEMMFNLDEKERHAFYRASRALIEKEELKNRHATIFYHSFEKGFREGYEESLKKGLGDNYKDVFEKTCKNALEQSRKESLEKFLQEWENGEIPERCELAENCS